MSCRWSDCWCRAWPPRRLVLSTGVLYTVQECPHLGSPWLFRYLYLETAA